VAQHQVQLDGIGAAISNLQFFHHSISKAYMQCEVSAYYWAVLVQNRYIFLSSDLLSVWILCLKMI